MCEPSLPPKAQGGLITLSCPELHDARLHAAQDMFSVEF